MLHRNSARGHEVSPTALNKEKSGQVSTNKGIITQNIFNVSVVTSV